MNVPVEMEGVRRPASMQRAPTHVPVELGLLSLTSMNVKVHVNILKCVHFMTNLHCGVTDIDECASGNGNCSQICDNTKGSFQCSCGVGYEQDSTFNCKGDARSYYISSDSGGVGGKPFFFLH